MFTNLNLTDMETCYKVFRREVLPGHQAQVEPLRLRAGDHRQDRQAAQPVLAHLRSAHQLLRPHLRGRQEDRPEGRLHGPLLHRAVLEVRLRRLTFSRRRLAALTALAAQRRRLTGERYPHGTEDLPMRPVLAGAPAQRRAGAVRPGRRPAPLRRRPPARRPVRPRAGWQRREGWAVGDEGVVWHTSDGGEAWERQPTGVRASLRSRAVPEAVHRLGRRPRGIAQRRRQRRRAALHPDGGIKWQRVTLNALPGLNRVRFLADGKTGFLAGDGTDQYPSGLFQDDRRRPQLAAGGRQARHHLAGRRFQRRPDRRPGRRLGQPGPAPA